MLEWYRFPAILGPQYLTVKSVGEAGKQWYGLMGVYHLTGEKRNKRSVWSRHDGKGKIYYNSGKFPFTEMTYINKR